MYFYNNLSVSNIIIIITTNYYKVLLYVIYVGVVPHLPSSAFMAYSGAVFIII